jgi:uncharacterized protein involved in exopolysaccharide biosynthesis
MMAKYLFKIYRPTFFILFLPLFCAAQPASVVKSPETIVKTQTQPVKSSPAYAEVLLEKVTLEAELADLLANYTDEFPKVKETRVKINLVDLALARIMMVKPEDSAKLSQALGKLMLRKIELQYDLYELQKKYSDQHPEVKSAKRKIEVFDKAVSEILQ